MAKSLAVAKSPKVLAVGVAIAVAALLVVVSQVPALAATDADDRTTLLVNFQDKDAATPKEYKADYGQAYTAERGYGWAATDGKPLSLVGNGRDRNLDGDQRLDTLMNMQLKPGSPGVPSPGRWKADVTNGTYQVTVATGDAGFTDSRHVLRVEEKVAIDFAPSNVKKFATETVTVPVADGTIDIDAVGGDNTKVNFIDIRPVQNAPAPDSSSTRSYKVNFAPRSAAAVSGYTTDAGEGYSADRGYGWETLTGGRVDLTSEGRERNINADKRLDTFLHVQSGRAPEGRWQLDVPNGNYKVAFGLGDPDYSDSRHLLRAEGLVIGQFVPSGNQKNKTFEANVAVTDGKLTLDQVGGNNTKINFVDVSPIASTEPTPTPTPQPEPPELKKSHKINFAPLSAPAIAGYVTDTGLGYAPSRTFGWETTTGGPIDLSSETRSRNKVDDKRFDSFVHMQSGRAPEGRWQLDIPNGTYAVNVGVGDPEYTDSRHLLRAEGQVLGEFTPSKAIKSQAFAGTVNVADGKLTLDQIGGQNTKLNYVDVEPATVSTPEPPAPASLTASAPQDYLRLGKRMVFSTVNNIPQAPQLVTLTNSGGTPARVTGVSFSGPQANAFRLADGQTPTLEVPAKDSRGIAIVFTPTATETNRAVMTVATDAGNVTVDVAGMNARNFEDIYEPSLQAIFDTLGYKVDAGVTNEYTNFISKSNGAVGDEVLSPYWRPADAAKPVSLFPLASYSGRNNYALGPAGFNQPNSTRMANNAYYLAGGTDQFGGENQRLFPKPVAGYSTEWPNPSAVFGVGFAGNFSDRTLNGAAQLHNVRIYPAKDGAGKAIVDTYLVTVDQGNIDCCYKNFDYQEGVFLATNVTPAR